MPKRKYSRDAKGQFASTGSSSTSKKPKATGTPIYTSNPRKRTKSAGEVWNEKVARGQGSTPQWAKEAQAKWDAKKAADNAIKKAKPTPLRTASGTVLNSGARLNNPPRKKRK